MYELAKKARSGMKSKAERLAGEKDRKVDSSDWSPAEPLNADVKTGMRPVSRRAYKAGGKVSGCEAPMRADRKARKSGGRVEQKGEQPPVDRYVNRDLKKANDYRDGEKHVGGLKRGGRAKKADGGSMTMEEMIKKNPAPKKSDGFKAPNPVPLPPRRQPEPVPPRDYEKADPRLIKAAKGGRMKRADGGATVDPRLGLVKPKALEFGQNMVTPGLKNGGRATKASGGSAEFKAAFRAARNAFLSGEGPKNFDFKGKSYSTDLAPTPKNVPLPPERPQPVLKKNISVEFGPPKSGMPDVDVMGNATGGGMKKGGRIKKFAGGSLGMSANRMMPQLPSQVMGSAPMQGSMPPMMPSAASSPPMASPSMMPLARASGGRTKSKGKTNINIVIATGGKKQPDSMVPTVPPAPMGAQPVPVPAAPPAAPIGIPPMPSAPMMGGAPSGPPAGPAMPPMPRKSGGRVSKVAHSFKDMTAGSGSGEGRLQKTDIAKRSAHKSGGKVYRSYKDMDAGAGSGEGRLEKTEIQKRKH